MAKTYKVTALQRAVNKVFAALARRGLGSVDRHVLTVRGRTSGTLRSTPVDVMQDGDARWLVAPYGPVNWVRNLRAAHGELTLRRGAHVENLLAQEVSTQDAIPVIRQYIRNVPVTRNYWDVTADSTDREIAQDSVHHPVFRLHPTIP